MSHTYLFWNCHILWYPFPHCSLKSTVLVTMITMWWTWTWAMDMNLRDGEGQGGLLCCSPWGHKESDPAGWLKTTTMQNMLQIFFPSLSFNLVLVLCPVFCCMEFFRSWTEQPFILHALGLFRKHFFILIEIVLSCFLFMLSSLLFQFSSGQSLGCAWPFATSGTAAYICVYNIHVYM